MRLGTTVLLAVAFPLVVLAGESSPPAGWKEVAGGYKKQAYLVWMPKDGKLDEKESSIVDPAFGQVRVFRTVAKRKDGSLFAAGQIILPPKLVKAPPKVRQDYLRDSFLDEFGATLIEEKRAKLGTMAGKEYLAKTKNGMARFQLFGTGVQIFRVAFVGTKKQIESKEVNDYFASFKRTPPKTKK